jgi:hypothetical protein
MSLDVMRKLAIAINDQRVSRVELAVCPDVALYLLNKKRAQLAELENETKKRVVIRHDSLLGLDELRLQLFDTREGLVFLESLGMSPHDQPGAPPPRGQGRHDRRGGRRDDRHGQRQQQPQQRHEQRRDEPREDERFDEIEGVEEAVDRREQQHAEESRRGVVVPAPVLASAPPETSEKGAISEEESNVIDVEEAVEPMGDAPGAIGEGDRGGERRGRRRRGRRGRGRGEQSQPQQRAPAEPGPAADDVSDESSAQLAEAGDSEASDDDDAPGPGNEKHPPQGSDEGDQPRRRRRRRGGRRHRRRRERQSAADSNGNVAANNSNDVDESEDAADEPQIRSAPPQRTPPQRAPEPPQPVVRTGSTDKHLIRDEDPVHVEPTRRPRTYRDLDAIPDDMD